MAPPVLPRWQFAAWLLVVISVSAAILGYSATHPAAPYCATDPGATVCPPADHGITYASEDVEVPLQGSNGPAIGNYSVRGIQFQLWALSELQPIQFLQGVADEPDGLNLAFVVVANGSWYSLDGLFGAAWISQTGESVEVQLSVADPPIVYALRNGTAAELAGTASMPLVTSVEGVRFALNFWPDGLAEELNASVLLANGTRTALALQWGGAILVSCTGFGGFLTERILAGSTCLEDADAGLGVGIAWYPSDPGDSITLMVRVG